MVAVLAVAETVTPTGFSKLKTKYSACCSKAVSFIIGILIVCVKELELVKFSVWVANVKSEAFAVLNGLVLTTKSTEEVVGLTKLIVKLSEPAVSLTVTKFDAKATLGTPVVKVEVWIVVKALLLKSSTEFGNKAK